MRALRAQMEHATLALPATMSASLYRLRRTASTTEVFTEILYETKHIRSLQENLSFFPKRLAEALRLDSFHVFLRDGTGFTQRNPDSTPVRGAFAFPASSSTVLHMKREHKPARFDTERPDTWQFLAPVEETDALSALGTQYLVPLVGRTALTGFASLSRTVDAPSFNSAELRFLEQIGTELGHGLETAMLVERLSQESVRRAEITRELELAREVQERLLPVTLPSVRGLDSAALYRSAEQIGGDYFDLFPTASGLFCAVIADVSGHGVSSALLMATLRASLHSLLEQSDRDLADTVVRLNRLLYSASSASRYSTLFLLLYDPDRSEVIYLNAGQNPPLLLRSDSSLLRLTDGGTVVGLLPAAAWQAQRVLFQPGDTLVAYTDGITETCNAAGEEWTETGLLRAVFPTDGRSAAETVARALAELGRFTGDVPQADDRTLLILRRMP